MMERAAQGFQAGRYDQTSALCKKIIRADPRHTGALGLLGVVSALNGKLSDSIKLFRKAVAIEPGNAILNKNLAKALVSTGEYQEGVKYYSRVVSLQPADSNALYDLACAYQKTGNSSAAESHFRQALTVNPNDVKVLTNLGSLLREQGRHHEAVTFYQNALAVLPNMQEALANLGLTLQELGDLQSAQAMLDKAIEQHPGDADAHLNRSICYLISGDYLHGWPEYEWRWKRSGKQTRAYGFPVWDGSSLSGRTILVYAEQGIGDEIMFASCLADICRQAKHVIIECEPRLAPLFQRSLPKATVHGAYQNEGSGWLINPGEVDTQVAIGSLPLHLRNKAEDFPTHQGYLSADPDRRSGWKKRLGELGQGLKIGISWQGGGTALARLARSIEIDRWEIILKTAGVHFVNLQYGDCQEAIRQFSERTGLSIHNFPEIDPLTDLDDFAALVSSLDLVISIDNSTVHLAGALGVPVWLLVPCVPDWRWRMAGEQTPWYPSLRLFRKAGDQDWNTVLSEVSTELVQRVAL